ncbi:hypothetical protein SAMN02745225_01622 [Ferrithrix thermotolerans DSM 19514]|uniref:Uncharacterized protein n=1 Tax=Ferrithrix thermotolerans DSM 19514 TaxID=1121881 RepID=A0A1M4WCB4_9ACTN|nr:hypothetical protein SAMN02745225_01622 [Ferrithrix thermotolerans DSM 19514]
MSLPSGVSDVRRQILGGHDLRQWPGLVVGKRGAQHVGAALVGDEPEHGREDLVASLLVARAPVAHVLLGLAGDAPGMLGCAVDLQEGVQLSLTDGPGEVGVRLEGDGPSGWSWK